SVNGARDGAFYALVQKLSIQLPRAQLIVVEPEARGMFGFFPQNWPMMSFEEAHRRATELKRRREPPPFPPQEPQPPVHAAPLEPSQAPEVQSAVSVPSDQAEVSVPAAADAAPDSYEENAAIAADAFATELDDVETPALPIPPM